MSEREAEPVEPPERRGEPAASTAPQDAREGPLRVARLRKDDGRALISYSHISG